MADLSNTPLSDPKPNPITLRLATASDIPQIGQLYNTVFAATFGHAIPASDLAASLATHYTPNPPSGKIFDSVADASNTFLVACASISNYASISASEQDPGQEREQEQGKEQIVVGFAQLNDSATDPCIQDPSHAIKLSRLYVSASWSGKGVARLLMNGIMGIAREMGMRRIWLSVWEQNKHAQAVYAKMGFERVGECQVGRGYQWTDWIMCRDL